MGDGFVPGGTPGCGDFAAFGAERWVGQGPGPGLNWRRGRWWGLAGAMMGLALAVAALLAKRWPSAGTAGLAACVSAGLVVGVGDCDGAGPRRCHGGPRHGALATWPARACSVSSPGCAGAARFGLEQGNRQPAPLSAVRVVRAVRPASIPATRWRKAAASSQAWGLAAGMASAWRAAASCLVCTYSAPPHRNSAVARFRREAGGEVRLVS